MFTISKFFLPKNPVCKKIQNWSTYCCVQSVGSPRLWLGTRNFNYYAGLLKKYTLGGISISKLSQKFYILHNHPTHVYISILVGKFLLNVEIFNLNGVEGQYKRNFSRKGLTQENSLKARRNFGNLAETYVVNFRGKESM